VSGYSRDRQTFELTYKKAHYWHDHRRGCPCDHIDQMVVAHILPAGFERDEDAKYPYTFRHPGHPSFPLGLLWEVLSGQPSTRGLYPDW